MSETLPLDGGGQGGGGREDRMLKGKKIGVVGGGKMGGALIEG